MQVTENFLKSASRNIYSFGSGDASEKVSVLNARYGLGKIHYTLEKIGIDSTRALTVFSPDGGVTRNTQRWQSGFSYGCYIRWPSVEESGKLLAFPEIKPNACGMLVAEINDIPEVKELCDRLHGIEKEGLAVESSSLKLNVGVSNHFIEVCKATESKTPKIAEGSNFAIIHTSPSEYKSILYDFNAWEAAGGRWITTPFGKILVLEDESARKYIDKYEEIANFSNLKRLKIAEKLFGDCKIISNEIHQGLSGDNEVRLGVYKIVSGQNLYPVAFRWDLQVYLVEAFDNLKENILRENGAYERAASEGVLDILESSNMLPHGGGYRIPFSASGWKIIKNGSKLLYSNKCNGNNFVFSSPSELPFSYRGLKIADKIDSLSLGRIVAKLKQLYTLKY